MTAGPTTSPALIEVLGESQRLGFLGDRPVDEVVEHARVFVRALPSGRLDVIDLGSGGGVPGLVIAHDRPDVDVVLLDRRTKRTDFLERAVRRLGWADRVTVVAGDASAFARLHPHRWDAVVARGFGPPERTVSTALGLLGPGGLVIVSEPPEGVDRWDAAWLGERKLRRVPSEPAVAVFSAPG
jgi:16S rRNA (guanine527-N7)-methyltransferase